MQILIFKRKLQFKLLIIINLKISDSKFSKFIIVIFIIKYVAPTDEM